MSKRLVRFAAVLAALAVPALASAQSEGAYAAAAALVLTPAGSFATVNPAAVGGTTGSQLGVDYASLTDANGFGLRLDQRGVRLQLGMVSIDEIDGRVYMAALGYGGTIAARPASPNTTFQLGYDLAVGYGRLNISFEDEFFGEEDFTVDGLTAGAKLPLAFKFKVDAATTFTPYFAPGLYFGRASESESGEDLTDSGTRFTLGGGLRVETGSRFSVEAGVQKIMIKDSDANFGLGVSYRFGDTMIR